MIKALIVDGSPYLRQILSAILAKDDGLHVMGYGENGKEALEKIPLLKPDLMTLDFHMPIMDGIITLEKINKDYSIPVVMISSYTKEGTNLTLKALEKGAIDFVSKLQNIFDMKEESILLSIIDKLKAAAKSNLNFHNIVNKTHMHYSTSGTSKDNGFEFLISIGASTGGPKALQLVLPLLPKEINGSIVVVQHMPPGFTKSLAERLNKLSMIEIKEGEEGDKLKRGCCYIAPGDSYMEVIKKDMGYYIQLKKRAGIEGLNSSIDTLMESVAKIKEIKKLGVIMTGMGSDGSKGIVNIKESGGFTIAQDEKTSVIFGMPKAAINTNYIDRIVPLNNIAQEIMNTVGV